MALIGFNANGNRHGTGARSRVKLFATREAWSPMQGLARQIRMARSSLVFVVLAVCLSEFFFGEANAVNPDPVVLTFSSAAGSIQMELGFISKIRLEAQDEIYTVKIFLEPEGVRFYNRFAFQHRALPTDLWLCKDKVYTYATMPVLRNGAFSLPLRYSESDAETVMNLLFYGDGCDNFP